MGEDKLKNFGIMIPQSSTIIFFGCRVSVDFESASKWEEFKGWIANGHLVQLQLDGNDIDVWVRRKTHGICGDCPASLQKHFNDYCAPIEFGFHSYPLQGVDMEFCQCYFPVFYENDNKEKICPKCGKIVSEEKIRQHSKK